MKSIIKIPGTLFWVILLLLSIFASCKKDQSSSATTTTTSGAFSYKVDGGATATLDSANATLYTVNKAREIDVYGFRGGKQVMEFHFSPKTGDQTVGGTFGSGALLTYLETPTSSFDSQSGSFNLSTCDTVGKKIVGTFSFVGKLYPYTSNTVRTITEGRMTVTKLSKQ
jgi:hypothetical protein